VAASLWLYILALLWLTNCGPGKRPCHLPVPGAECKSFIIPEGNTSLRKNNIFNGTENVWLTVMQTMVRTTKTLFILKILV
jgi:hypothetical protein